MSLAYAKTEEYCFEAYALPQQFLLRGTALRCENISAEYYGRQALYDISCEVRKYSILAIMGPSGCGKSTFLKTLNRSLELTPGANVTGGEVWFGGRNIYAEKTVDPILRRRVGSVLQRPVIFPMSIKENVIFGPRFRESKAPF